MLSSAFQAEQLCGSHLKPIAPNSADSTRAAAQKAALLAEEAAVIAARGLKFRPYDVATASRYMADADALARAVPEVPEPGISYEMIGGVAGPPTPLNAAQPGAEAVEFFCPDNQKDLLNNIRNKT